MILAPVTNVRTIMQAALALAFAGSLLGLVIGPLEGSVAGFEFGLVLSCTLFTSAMILILRRRTLDTVPWVAPVSTIYFLAYLTVGAALAIAEGANVQKFLIYIGWFFPLLAFNRFVNLSTWRLPLAVGIFSSGLLLFAARLLSLPDPMTEVAVLTSLTLAGATTALVLDLFAKYREAWIEARERATALESVHEAVRASEAHFRRLFTNAASGIGWLSLDGACMHVNETFAAMVGRPVETLQGEAFVNLVNAADRARWLDLLHSMRAAGEVEHRADLLLDGPGSRTLRARLSFALVVREGDTPEALAFVCLDHTKSHELEVQLSRAERLESLGQLTGGVAHDFNNLLTVVLGNAELIASDAPPSDPNRERARVIIGAAERGSRLVRELLAFAKRQPLKSRQTDVGALIRNLSELLRASLGSANTLRLDLDPGLWSARVDPSELERALLNLCTNARDALSHPAEVIITAKNLTCPCPELGHIADLAPGDYVSISVVDRGDGMSPEVLGRVFEPFFTTKGVGKGTGLGLPMVFGFAKQSGGHVSITSALREGTTVQLLLPRAEGSEAFRSSARIDTGPRVGQPRVLAVEDDPLVRRFATSQLRALGFTVTAVASADEALAVLETETGFDLLFTDIRMPGRLNGAQLAVEARRIAPDLPVLCTSGYADAAELGVTGELPMLPKPYTRAELAAAIAAALPKR